MISIFDYFKCLFILLALQILKKEKKEKILIFNILSYIVGRREREDL